MNAKTVKPPRKKNPIDEKFRAWFKGLDAKRKRQVVVIGTSSAALLLVVVLSSITPDKRTEVKQQSGSKRGTPNLLQTQTEGMGLDSVSNDVRALQDEVSMLRDELEKEKSKPPPRAEPAPASTMDPDEALTSMRDAITGSPTYQAPTGTTLNPERPRATTPSTPARSTGPAAAPPPPPTAPTMRVVRGEAAEVATLPPPPAPRDVYIPTGSILTGVLLNGLDAPTGRNAQSQPVPVVVRLKHEAILPSLYRSDVREAFVLAAGFGDLSSERAYLRAERLSMILRDGRVIDVPIKMAAVGSDGKTGVRGTVVSKQGALIAKALLAGTAEGVSRAFGGNSYGSFGRGNELPSSNDLIVSGVGGGTSSALDRVASYFLQQAEAMYPVVEISAGREVSFILLEGTDLATRATAAEDSQAMPAPAAAGAP